MVDILTQKKAKEQVINKFIKDTSRVSIPFQAIVNAIKSREGRNWQKRKTIESVRERSNSSHEEQKGLGSPGSPGTSSVNIADVKKNSQRDRNSSPGLNSFTVGSRSKISFATRDTLDKNQDDYQKINSAISRKNLQIPKTDSNN